jgi:archaemetzincin
MQKLFISLVFAISFYSCKYIYPEYEIHSASSYFEEIGKNDEFLSSPIIGEWLYEHKESGQNYSQYQDMNPIRPSGSKAVIYLLPYGKFDTTQLKILDFTREYVEIYFQRKTILQNPIPDNNLPKRVYRDRGEGNTQLLAGYVLDTVLKNKTPKNGIALMAFSEKDLFPKLEWNFVFGLASYTDRVGVSSIYRLGNKPWTDSMFRLSSR